MKYIDKLLLKMTERRSSDLHIKVGRRPISRVDGHLAEFEDEPVLTDEAVRALIAEAVRSEVPGPAGKSAYELAVEQGFTGTLQEWLAQFDMKNALKGKTFDFTAANARKFADAIKLIFEALGGTVS